MTGQCRECGCTDERPCILEPDPDDLVEGVDLLFEAAPTTCSWVEPDLCSACHRPDDDQVVDPDASEAPVVVDCYGVPWRGKRP
jgi:hypothetical protein